MPSLVPRPTPFFSVLRFVLTIIHGCGRAALPHLCISYQRKPKNGKNGVGLGTRLEFTIYIIDSVESMFNIVRGATALLFCYPYMSDSPYMFLHLFIMDYDGH